MKNSKFAEEASVEYIEDRIGEIESQLITQTGLTTFVLDKETQKLIDEMSFLQSICPHNFVDGICSHCGVED